MKGMIIAIPAIIIIILVLVYYIREKLRGYTVKAVFAKTAVSVLFVAAAVLARSTSAMAPFVILGLVFGLLGDIWLDLKYVYPQHDKPFTYAGFIVFGIGHIMYVSGLLAQYGAGMYLAIAFALAAAAAAIVMITEKPMKLVYGEMKPVVLVYGFLLFSMVAVSGLLLFTRRDAALTLFFAGGVLFAISDLILSGTFFGEGRERPVDIISNYIFYYSGQFLIAFSLMFI